MELFHWGSIILQKGFFQKLHQISIGGVFLCLFWWMTLGVKQEKQNMSQTKIWPVDPLTLQEQGWYGP